MSNSNTDFDVMPRDPSVSTDTCVDMPAEECAGPVGPPGFFKSPTFKILIIFTVLSMVILLIVVFFTSKSSNTPGKRDKTAEEPTEPDNKKLEDLKAKRAQRRAKKLEMQKKMESDDRETEAANKEAANKEAANKEAANKEAVVARQSTTDSSTSTVDDVDDDVDDDVSTMPNVPVHKPVGIVNTNPEDADNAQDSVEDKMDAHFKQSLVDNANDDDSLLDGLEN
jgi:FtsZ-interacting cell division protein ZipA